MQDLGYELLRIYIPRTPVNKAKKKGRSLSLGPVRLPSDGVGSKRELCALLR
jgi:hypothetical protein